MHFFAGLYKHATKKELIPAKGYPMGPPPMPPWYPGSSEEKVNFTAECECFDCASFTITSCSLLHAGSLWMDTTQHGCSAIHARCSHVDRFSATSSTM